MRTIGAAAVSVLALLACAPRSAQFSGAALDAPESLEKIRWLRSHASPIRSIDPADEDFSDLAPIGRAIGDARIVFLGEASHGEGGAILGRTRLVKYLHQRRGFDVLVWEGGFYEAPKVWDALRNGDDPVEALDLGVPRAWSWAGEIEPLARYVAAQARGPRPLYHAGYDAQLWSGSRTGRIDELRAFLKTLALDATVENDRLLWQGLGWSLASDDPAAADPIAVERFAERVERLRQAIDARQRDPLSRLWQQHLENAVANARQQQRQRLEMAAKDSTSWSGFNTRDEQGARNLLWLAKDRYRAHKLIVWSATIHAARNIAGVDTRDPAWSYVGARPTGDHVWNALGKQIYALGFVALEGGGRLGDQAWQIKQAQHPAAELEELLGAAGFETAFLDYRRIPRGGEWLREPMLSRPFAEHAKIARWPDVLDGIVFLREMKPATWPNFAERIKRIKD